MSRKKTISASLAISMLLVIIMVFAVSDVGVAAPAGIAYTNSNLGFSLTLPARWAGLYRTEERSNGVSFINIRNENAGFGGFLFGIFVSNDMEPIEYGYRLLTSSGGMNYFSATPTDVQFAYENSSLRTEYQTMEGDISTILGTFRINSAQITARPTLATVIVNGKNVSFDAYVINGNNYFKLRDVAYVLSGTAKQFEVDWDGANNAIRLTSGKRYTVIGGEMASRGTVNRAAYPTSASILLNGRQANFTAYHIDGNNYFMLRDIGRALNFSVNWQQSAQSIVIDTSKPYTPD